MRPESLRTFEFPDGPAWSITGRFAAANMEEP
jgi:hypothetical protein